MNIELEIYLDSNNLFDNFIARGSVIDLKTEIIKNISMQKTNFSFFADKSDVLLKNISAETGPIKIRNGDLKLKLSSEISLNSNFTTNLEYNDNSKNFKNFIKDFEYLKDIVNLEAELNNTFFINFDETYKVKEYNYKSSGNIKKANFNFKKPLGSFF